MGNGAVTGAGSATIGDTTSPSALKKMIQSVGWTCCDWFENYRRLLMKKSTFVRIGDLVRYEGMRVYVYKLKKIRD